MLRLGNQLGFGFSFTYPCPRKLRQIMKMSMIEKESASKIKDIWNEYHASRTENVSSTIDKHQYQALRNNLNRAPMFLLPVKRNGGHFKLLTQWQNNSILLTYLEDYKRQGTSAAPYFVVTMFPELLFIKGLVLIRGDIIGFKLTKPEAQGVVEQLKQTYLNPQLFDLAQKFNHRTDQFSQARYDQLFRL